MYHVDFKEMIYLNKIDRFGLYKIFNLTCLIFIRKMSLKILIRYIKSWYTKKMSIETFIYQCYRQFKFILDEIKSRRGQ